MSNEGRHTGILCDSLYEKLKNISKLIHMNTERQDKHYLWGSNSWKQTWEEFLRCWEYFIDLDAD